MGRIQSAVCYHISRLCKPGCCHGRMIDPPVNTTPPCWFVGRYVIVHSSFNMVFLSVGLGNMKDPCTDEGRGFHSPSK